MSFDVSVRGDFGALEALSSRAKEIAARGFVKPMMAQAAEAGMTELRRGFRAGVDPYGRAWAKLKKRKGQPLRDTGRLASSFSFELTGDGFRIFSNVTYGAVHQSGASIKTKGRANAHEAKGGRFMSRAKASRAKGSVKVSFSPGGTITIPARKMVPDVGWGEWAAPIAEVLEDAWVTLWR